MTATLTFTQLQDMIVPQVWQKYILQESVVKTNFWTSGILSDLTPEVGSLLGGGGTSVNMPFFNDLNFDGNENEGIWNDGDNMTVDKITTGMDVATVIERYKAWGSTDFAGDLSGADPLPVIASRFGAYWARQMQQILLSLCAGTMASASMSSNVNDISGATGAAGVFDAHSFIDAKYRLGDRAADLSAIAVHSDTMRLMEQADLIDYIKPSDGGEQIATYMGKLVIVNDVMPQSGGVYTTYLFGPGAIGYAEGNVKVPVELFREPTFQMGRETLINRRKFALHIRGIKWVGTPASTTVSNGELATGTNWTRVYNPKLIKLVAFKHRNA